MGINRGETDYPGKLEQAAQLLRSHAGPIAILAHVDPDGDAIGSCLGLARALSALGQQAQVYARVPRYLRFLLEHEGEVRPPPASLSPGTLVVVLDVDAHDYVRVEGASLEGLPNFVLNIDHHGTNARRASLSIVEPDKAACALMVAELLEAMALPLAPAQATPLLTGIITDTGSFRFSNTTPEVLRVAARLLEAGAELERINESLAQTPHCMYLLQARVLETVEFLHGGLTVAARVNTAMLNEVGARWEDVESLIGIIRSAEGTELAVLFKDYGDTVKLSMRSRGRASAQNIAIALGGGGHVAAAGASVSAPYPTARSRFETEALRELRRAGFTPTQEDARGSWTASAR